MTRDERPEDRPPTANSSLLEAGDVEAAAWIWPDGHKPSDLLDGMVGLTRRYVACNEDQADALALWVLHCYCFSAARRTPYLAITSAEVECGKTRLLEVLERLVPNPWLTERTSPAALVRTLAVDTPPTLLLDESDTAFSADKEYAEALRNVLNSGYRRNGSAVLCVKQSGDWVVKRFNTFGPKAIAGIGTLPTTVASRSISIRLQRRAPGETVEDFYEDEAEEIAAPLRIQATAFAEERGAELEKARRPVIPPGLRDRAGECWRPLFAIADAVGEGWPERARKAAVNLAGPAADEASHRIRVLADIHQVFAERDTETLFSSVLAEALNEVETSPWAEWSRGRGLSPTTLANLLHPYGIKPRSVRIGDETKKGYKKAQFSDVWERYLGPDTPIGAVQDVTASQPASVNGSEPFPSRHTALVVTAPEESANPHEYSDVTGVTARTPGYGQGELDLGTARLDEISRQHEEGLL